MADLGEVFDPSSIPPSEFNGEPIPAGAYPVQVVHSELVDLKSGNGQALVLELEIMEGQYANRKLWDRLNIRHTNEQTQTYALRTLADLFEVTGSPPSRDSDVLHFKPMLATVKIDPAKDGYAAKNVVKGYKALAGGAPKATGAKPTAGAKAAAPAPAKAAGSRPWARG